MKVDMKMSALYKLLLAVFLIYITEVDSGRQCLNCKSIPQPLDCTDLVECGDNEECFTERYVTYDGITLFNVGCRDSLVCSKVVRAVGDTITCIRCCNQTDLCQLQSLCGSEGLNVTRRDICYSCPFGMEQPDQCRHITLCGHDQSCSMNISNNIIGQRRYQPGCFATQGCDKQNSIQCCHGRICNNVWHSKPHITSPHQNKVFNVRNGQNVTIQCQANGDPLPKYTYEFSSDNTLPGNLVLAGKYSEYLHITNYSPKNDGLYHCYAENSYGYDRVTFQTKGH